MILRDLLLADLIHWAVFAPVAKLFRWWWRRRQLRRTGVWLPPMPWPPDEEAIGVPYDAYREEDGKIYAWKDGHWHCIGKRFRYGNPPPSDGGPGRPA